MSQRTPDRAIPTRRVLGAALGLGALVALLSWASGWGRGGDTTAAAPPPGTSPEMIAVVLPALTRSEAAGQASFAANCAACHGPNAGGIEGAGPPLIHKIYEPGHHADISFFYAATRGVKSHHWPFGDMAPVAGVTEDDILSIIAFVRRVQRENGIL